MPRMEYAGRGDQSKKVPFLYTSVRPCERLRGAQSEPEKQEVARDVA
jgi:hypothetical protein